MIGSDGSEAMSSSPCSRSIPSNQGSHKRRIRASASASGLLVLVALTTVQPSQQLTTRSTSTSTTRSTRTTTTTTSRLGVSTTTPMRENDASRINTPKLEQLQPQPLEQQQLEQQQQQQQHPWWMLYFQLWNAVLVWQDRQYAASLNIKCPFLRRRSADLLDTVDQTLQQLYQDTVLPVLATTTSSSSSSSSSTATTTTATMHQYRQQQQQQHAWTPIAWRTTETTSTTSLSSSSSSTKTKLDWTIDQVALAVAADWKPSVNMEKGYYVTGRLNSSIYSSDCRFDGPDPDLPIQGLRKYCHAAAGLFDPRTSRATLHKLEIVVVDPHENKKNTFIQAHWTFRGTLRLPWHPRLPVVHGTTRYYMDHQNDESSNEKSLLITRHVETWHNLNAWQAFWHTFVVPPPPTDADDANGHTSTWE